MAIVRRSWLYRLGRFLSTGGYSLIEPVAETKVVLSVEEAKALQAALEDYMKLQPIVQSYPTYRRLWNAADKALVPLRGRPDVCGEPLMAKGRT